MFQQDKVGESGYYGNQNALKDKGRQRDTNLNIRVNSGDKAAWELAAKKTKMTTTDWVIRALNEAEAASQEC